MSARRAGPRIGALAAAALLALAGCSGGDNGTASTAADSAAGGTAYEQGVTGSDAARPAAGPAAPAADPDAAKNTSGADLAAANAASARRIRTASVTLTVKDLDTAAVKVRAIADGLGGYVSNETTGISQPVDAPEGSGADTPGRSVQSGEGVVVLRIPEPELDAALTQVRGVGTVVSRSATDQDVTGEIADVASRIETQQQSVARTRELLAKANSVQDIVFIEGELTRRQADLEALQARLKSLSSRADLSTLTVTLQVPGTPAAQGQAGRGFLAGLQAGWQALVASTNVILTVLGALLPVGLVLAVVGYPARVLLRRRTQRRTAPTVPVMAGPPAQPPSDTAAP